MTDTFHPQTHIYVICFLAVTSAKMACGLALESTAQPVPTLASTAPPLSLEEQPKNSRAEADTRLALAVSGFARRKRWPIAWSTIRRLLSSARALWALCKADLTNRQCLCYSEENCRRHPLIWSLCFGMWPSNRGALLLSARCLMGHGCVADLG